MKPIELAICFENEEIISIPIPKKVQEQIVKISQERFKGFPKPLKLNNPNFKKK